MLAPFMLSHGFATIPFGLVFIAISLFGFYLPIVSGGAPQEFILFSLIFVVMGVAFAFGQPIMRLLAYRNTEYVITDRRLITQTGAVGLDTRFVDLEKVQEVYVNIGVVDKLLGTGSISAVTAGQVYVGAQGGSLIGRPSLASLKEPYEVQRLLQEAIEKTRTPQTPNVPIQPTDQPRIRRFVTSCPG